MELICAIDLMDGGAVRLQQGDFGRRVASAPDPVALAQTWVAAGARRIHVVDLVGARAGVPAQRAVIGAVAAAVHLAALDAVVEAGGGLRREADVSAVFDTGVDAAMLGTAAIERPGFLAACVRDHPGRILASLDLRAGRTALDGWTRTGLDEPIELARRLLDEGAERLILTDAGRDGTLGGPNLDLLARFRAAFPDAHLVAAGGISGVADLEALAAVGVDGAVVGLALLSGRLGVAEALAAVGVAA